MPFTVEDGTGVEGANSYCSVEDFADYLSERYPEETIDDNAAAQAALIRGTLYIDGEYRSQFPGQRTNGRSQGLEWPRQNVLADSGELMANDELPQELIDATCEAARRELAEVGSLLPDTSYAELIASEAVGPISVTYANARLTQQIGAGSATKRHIPVIDAILAPILFRTPRNQAFLSRG